MGLLDESDGGLVTYLKSLSAVTALVGAGTAARIKPDLAKRTWDTPYIVYTGAGGESPNHLLGIAGLRSQEVQISCYGGTRTQADQLAEAVKVNVQRQASQTWASTFIDHVNCSALFSGVDKPEDDGDRPRYWTRLNLTIVHAEATS